MEREADLVEHNLYWQADRWLALEHRHLREDENEIHADGLMVGAFDGAPLRLRYELECDHSWRTTAVVRVIDLNTGEHIELQHTRVDGWRDSRVTSQAALVGAIDVDIAATPFTNTLPIRRLKLDPEQAEEITVVYLAVTPSLSFRPVHQRYTRLTSTPAGDRYLYESLESEFKRELIVDADGFVLDYPGIWRRAETGAP